MNAGNIETVMWLFFGIIAVPTFFLSVLNDAVNRKEKKCSNHPSQSKSNIS